MQRTTRIVLTILLVAALAALILPGALSQGPGQGQKEKRGKAFVADEMYNVVSVTGATGSYVSFDILGTAIKSKDGRVVVMNESDGRTGTYYFANDTAVLPFANKTDKKRPRPVMGDYNNSTINVAGATAVIAMKNVSTSGGRGNFTMQFTDVGVYLPNGTGKSYKLTAPARITRSADNKSMMITGNPSLRAAMQDALTGGGKFPASAAPVMLKTIDGK